MAHNHNKIVLYKILDKISLLEEIIQGITMDEFLKDRIKQHAAAMAFLNNWRVVAQALIK